MNREENPIQKQQRKELEKIEICMDILKDTRNVLYISMRFFDVILNKLESMPRTDVEGMGTDGFFFYFYPDTIIRYYKQGTTLVNRGYLHATFHCLFQHLTKPEDIEEAYWNLSCDIVVESIIDELQKSPIRMYQSAYRKDVYKKLKLQLDVFTPKGVYKQLCQMNLDDLELEKMQREFFVDNHEFWSADIPPERQMERERQWKDLNEKLQTEMETFSKEASENQKSLLDQVKVLNRQRYDYKTFLQKFAVFKEEVQVDEDSFDYIFYHYGMSLYGNMPLIEPQETKEVRKIEEFVIAIDTSMSCKEQLVKKFLEETYQILSRQDSFFRKVHIHIIQCDDEVRSDVVITNQKEMQEYMDNFEIKGFGGTDFRPVFGHVNQLLKQKVFHRLKGLIYFTDGYGTFPAKRPLYETAFVFMKEDYRDIDVPVWAIKLIIEPEQIEQDKEKFKWI